MSEPKQFPIQTERGAKAHPRQIPWSLAGKAYSVYAAQHGTDQSIEQLAERGGFHPSEMDMFVPEWRDEASEITTLRAALAERDARIAALEAENAKQHTELREVQIILTGIGEIGFAMSHPEWTGPVTLLGKAAAQRMQEREQAEARCAELEADADWRHRWHARLGRSETEPEGKFYERIEALQATLTAIRALSTQWRVPGLDGALGTFAGRGRFKCADDLDRLLPAPQETP